MATPFGKRSFPYELVVRAREVIKVPWIVAKLEKAWCLRKIPVEFGNMLRSNSGLSKGEFLPRFVLFGARTGRIRPNKKHLGGSLVGVWNGWGYGIAFFRALKFQISEPEICGKNRSFCRISRNFVAISASEKYFSDSGKWPFHTPPIHTPTKCRTINIVLAFPQFAGSLVSQEFLRS